MTTDIMGYYQYIVISEVDFWSLSIELFQS